MPLPTTSNSDPLAEAVSRERNPQLTERERALLDAGEMLWIVLANVSGGDWTKQTERWQQAARHWADNFHSVAAALNAKVA